MGPLALAGIDLAASTLNRLLMPKPDLFNPEQYKSDILPDINKMRFQAGRDIQKSILPQQAGIMQFGSARRLPPGAILSALQGLGSKAAEATSEIEPRLEETRRSGILDYLNMLGGYKNQMAGMTADRFNFTGEIGSLTQAMILSNAGLLPGGNQKILPDQPGNNIGMNFAG